MGLLVGWCRNALLQPKRELEGLLPDGRRPADIFLPAWDHGRGVCIDVGVTCPLQKSFVKRTAKKSGVAAKNYADKKRIFYEDDLARGNLDFVPFVVETLGGLGAQASKFLGKLANLVAERYSEPPSVTKQRMLAQLSCCIWRGTGARLDNRTH